MRALGVAPALAFLLWGAAASAAELVVTVEGVRSDKGDLYLSIYASPAEWPDKSARERDQKQKARRGAVVFRYQLPPGTYAANGYHDENGNGKFDTDFLGIPEEGYMFSNDARPLLSAPSFEAAAFKLPPEGAQITMRVRY